MWLKIRHRSLWQTASDNCDSSHSSCWELTPPLKGKYLKFSSERLCNQSELPERRRKRGQSERDRGKGRERETEREAETRVERTSGIIMISLSESLFSTLTKLRCDRSNGTDLIAIQNKTTVAVFRSKRIIKFVLFAKIFLRREIDFVDDFLSSEVIIFVIAESAVPSLRRLTAHLVNCLKASKVHAEGLRFAVQDIAQKKVEVR
jgi:hypothetical protein